MQRIALNEPAAALRRISFFAKQPGTNSGATGLTIGGADIKIAKGTGTGASAAGSNAAELDSTNLPGRYVYTLDPAEVDTEGVLNIRITDGSNMDAVELEVEIVKGAIGAINAGTAQAGAARSITLATTASATANFYRGAMVVLTGGTGAGQTRRIMGYTTGRVATVDEPWATNPDGTSTYQVLPACGPFLDGFGVVAADGGNTASTFKTDLTESTDNHWNDAFLVFVSGSLRGQVHKIFDYTGATKFVTFLAPGVFTAAPSTGDAFILINK